MLEHARVAAQAEFDLARIRHIKAALIERAFAFGALEPPRDFESSVAELRYLKSVVSGQARSIKPQRINATTMPSQELERTAEAVRGALVELEKLHRYESRAASRRDRAIREMVKIKSSGCLK